VCILLLVANTYDFFLIGQIALQGYYAVHDLDKSSISFAPLINSHKSPLLFGTVPETLLSNRNQSSFIQMYGGWIYLLFVVIVYFLIVYPFTLKNYSKETQEAIAGVYFLLCAGFFIAVVAPLLGIQLPSFITSTQSDSTSTQM
jgi:cation transport ATPase